MDSIFFTVMNMSITGSMVILAVLLVRLPLKRAPKLFSYLLWIVVLFRLICPFALSTSVGLPQVMINNQGTSIRTASQTIEPLKDMEKYVNLDKQNQQILNQNSLVSGEKEVNVVQAVKSNSNWKQIVIIIEYVWMLGVLILLLYSLLSYWNLKQELKYASYVDENIFELEKLPTPFVLGFIKPSIYLPVGIIGEEREYILAHERMHIKRKDYLVKLIGFLVATLHWMNPLVWVAFLCMSKDMEMSCDEAVISNFGIEIKKKYSTLLLNMAMPQKKINMAPLAFGEGNVKSRIQNVLKYKKTGIGILLLCVCVLGAAILILTTNRTTPESQMTMGNVTETLDGSTPNSSEEELELIESQITKWAQAFCSRDGEVIISMISDEVKEQMSASGMLEVIDGSGRTSFGDSSPWPMEPDNAYRIVNINTEENTAEILYYAVVSDPHVSVWQENISFSLDGENIVLTGEKLNYLDNIGSAKEYRTAYPEENINNTMMDYDFNGMGQTLNTNALLSGSFLYKDLFQPDTAAIYLLNLDKNKVETSWGYLDDGTDDVFVQLLFNDTNEPITIMMTQPYVSEGIWIPKNMKSSQDIIEKDAMGRFMEIPWNEIEGRNLKFTGDILTNREIQCIGEIPQYQIKLFGYGDADFWGEGVAIQIEEDVNYFDWNYMSARMLPPSVYWKDSDRQLQVALKIYAGTGFEAEELHILQQYEAGDLSDNAFTLDDYSNLLSETVDYQYDQKTKKLQFIDASNNTVLTEIENVDVAGGIDGLELGMISSFLLGEQIILQVESGYFPNGSVVAEYENMPTLQFLVMCEYDENGILQFSLGKPELIQ